MIGWNKTSFHTKFYFPFIFLQRCFSAVPLTESLDDEPRGQRKANVESDVKVGYTSSAALFVTQWFSSLRSYQAWDII